MNLCRSVCGVAGKILKDDFGKSLYSPARPADAGCRAQPTLILSISSLLVAVVIGIPTGSLRH